MYSLTRFVCITSVLLFVSAASQAQGFHNESIIDPSLNMKAYDVSHSEWLEIPGYVYVGRLLLEPLLSGLARLLT